MLTDKQKGQTALRLNGVLPEVSEAVKELLAELEAKGLYFIVSLGMRTIAEQNALYAIGRSLAGRKVTNACGGFSWHNFGRAVDLVLVRDGGVIEWENLDTNADGMADYSQMGQMAKNHGFIWGGDFKGLADFGHIEYHPGLTLAQARTSAGLTV